MGFSRSFILRNPQDKNITISRAAILQWLKTADKFKLYQERRESVVAKLAEHEGEVEERKELLMRIRETGGLLSQRFDIVPTTFESALYLDLMRMLERGGAALRCSYCGLPIPNDHSGRANKQRARSKKGLPVYHPDCFADVSRERKKTSWQRRARSPQFQESEKKRARRYRNLS